MKIRLLPAVLHPSTPRTAAIWVLFITFMAYSLRVWTIDWESFWFDEAIEAQRASASLFTLLVSLGQAIDPPNSLYTIILKGWMELVGRTEFALRYLALVPGVLIVPLFYAVGVRAIGRGGGLVAALFSSVSSYLIYYSQENRMYSLLAFLSLLSVYLLWRGLHRGGWKLWVVYGVTVAAITYTHIFGAFILLTHWILLALQWGRYSSRRSWLLALVVASLVFAPLGLGYLRGLVEPQTIAAEYFGRYWGILKLDEAIIILIQQFSTRYIYFSPEVIIGLFGSLSLIGFLPRDRHDFDTYFPQRIGFLLPALFLPILGIAVIMSLGIPIFSDRYMIIVLPF